MASPPTEARWRSDQAAADAMISFKVVGDSREAYQYMINYYISVPEFYNLVSSDGKKN